MIIYMYLCMYVFNTVCTMTQHVVSPLRGSYLSVDDLLVIVQLVDMATTAFERRDPVQLDAALKRITGLRTKYSKVRQLIETLSKRRSLGSALTYTPETS
jgi:hypothetical protein